MLREALHRPNELYDKEQGDQYGAPAEVEVFDVAHIVAQQGVVSLDGALEPYQQYGGEHEGEELYGKVYQRVLREGVEK